MAVWGLAVDLDGAEACRLAIRLQVEARRDERREDDRLPVLRDCGRDLRQVRLKGGRDASRLEVASDDGDAVQVDLKRDGARLDPAKPAVADGVDDGVVEGDCLEDLAEAAHVSTVRRGRDAEDAGAREVFENCLVRVRERVVALVDDDEVELVSPEPREAARTAHGLDGADDDHVRDDAVDASARGLLGLLKSGLDAGCAAYLVDGLFQELAPVREHQDALPAHDGPLREGREEDRLAGARGHLDEA